MKTYKEMTENVLAQAKRERQNCKRKLSVTLAAIAGTCCLCLIAISALLPRSSGSSKPNNETNHTPRIGFAIHCSALEEEPAKLIKDIVVPCESIIRVCNVMGLSEEERDKAYREEERLAKEMWADTDAACSRSHRISETAIISLISIGELELIVEDINEVVSKEVIATEMGMASLGYTDYCKGNDNIVIFFDLSHKAVQMIERNPDINLSELDYSLTVIVKFKDGTTETALIDILIGDDGYMYAVHRGVTVTV